MGLKNTKKRMSFLARLHTNTDRADDHSVAGVGYPACRAESTDGFWCTRKKKHKGPHIAHGLFAAIKEWKS